MTDAQKDASRLNGAKSHGPATPEGKARSSQNAIKTGIYAKFEILYDEDLALMEAMIAEYHDHYQPVGPAERLLVDTMIRCTWTLQRLGYVEQEVWHHSMDQTPWRNRDNPDLTRTGRAAVYLEGRAFDRLQRRLTATQRNFVLALKELTALQKDRPKVEPIQPAEPVSEPVAEAAQDGLPRFAPSNSPQPSTDPVTTPAATPAPAAKPPESAPAPAAGGRKEPKSA